MNRVLCFIASIVYRRWLYDGFTGRYCKVVKVKGWKTLLVDRPAAGRQTIQPVFFLESAYYE